MLLLVGLGNPGSQYARQRHNVGFMAVDEIHRRHGFAPWLRRFQAEVSEGRFGDAKCLLLKPQTFMNESGRAVGEAVNFFKLQPDAVVVIHDEVDLPPGKTRVKAGGGSAGHNGLKSITAAIGDGYRRIRVGIGHPGRREVVPHYVLHDFARADQDWLEPLLDAIAENAPLLATHRDSTFANRLHATLAGDDDRGRKAPPKDAPGATPGKRHSAADAKGPAEPQGPLASLRKLLGG